MELAVKPSVLVAGRVDAWLVGGLGVLLWGMALVGQQWGMTLSSSMVDVVFWVGAALTAAHFGLSYHLAYGFGATAARARPVPLIAFPAVLAVGLTIVAVTVRASGGSAAEHHLAGAGITSVFLLTAWHYLKQTYGVGRVAAGYAGVRLTKVEGHVLRYALYPLWFYNAGQILEKGNTYYLDQYRFGASLLPTWCITGLHIAAYAALAPIVIVFMRIGQRAPLPGMLLMPYLAAALWFMFPVNPVATSLVLAPVHALQYLAIGHRAELGLALGRRSGTSFAWWLNIALAVTSGGLLATRWLPGWLDHRIDPAAPLLASAMFFTFLNLHHYVIDATVWRSNGTLIKALRTDQRNAEAPVSARPIMS